MDLLSIGRFITAALKFFRVWGKLLVVVVPAVAGFVYSPVFRQVFLGIALGALALFGLQYAEIFPPPATQYCINPKSDPNGPKCMTFVNTDELGHGYWKVCDGLQ